MRVEPYDARLGCLAFPHDGVWLVVEPTGRVLVRTTEYEARTIAMCRNLLATDEERERWAES